MPSDLSELGDVESEVLDRYAQGAVKAEPALCCPTSAYDPRFIENLPREIVEKDYGCGDPSRYVNEGDTVVDLGSGSGKVCYILAQKVGPTGRVIGLDFNDAMLGLARKYLDEMANKLGYRNVRFHKARIQDMALDLDKAQLWLTQNPITSIEQVAAYQAHCDRLRGDDPAVTSDSVDVIVSNCVLNLVRPQDKRRLFDEMYRVLKPGGRAVISDIVCDEDPTPAIMADPKLWSGCISGAFREDRFLEMFQRAGFYGVQVLSYESKPWQTIDGVEFRSMTVRAYKGKEGPCLERYQSVIYQGPWKQVQDDDGHTLSRGQRMAVCDKTYRILTHPGGPYAQQVIAVPPCEDTPLDEAKPFDCKGSAVRDPRQTKGVDGRTTQIGADQACCEEGQCC